MINLIICGISGKMGKIIYSLAKKDENFNICCGVDTYDAKIFDCPIFSNFDEVDIKGDVIIDFSRPDCLSSLLQYAVKNNCPAILCTTGYSEKDIKEIDEASKSVALFRSGNMSIGINLLIELCKKASEILGDKFDIEIVEKHHNLKVDAPSGTALMLGNAVKEVLPGKEFNFGRTGNNCKRDSKEIGFHSIRGGTIVGQHDVIFAGDNEIITLSHEAESKQVFANGALKASKFIINKPAKLYSMKDLI